ncbi:MAG: hypothetical protein L7F77_12560, partial [Candidatus Magnetominusculus sp. LBB02]|nr:hypothetical protein [Candidatus Magnetominusculus sp. LBB02]
SEYSSGYGAVNIPESAPETVAESSSGYSAALDSGLGIAGISDDSAESSSGLDIAGLSEDSSEKIAEVSVEKPSQAIPKGVSGYSASSYAGSTGYDALTLNMTVTHCRQLLRISPEFALLIEQIKDSDLDSIQASVPVTALGLPPELQVHSKAEFFENIQPAAASFMKTAVKDSEKYNMLTNEYNYFKYTEVFIKAAMAACVVIILAALLGLSKTAVAIKSDKDQISSLRLSNSDMDSVLKENKQLMDEIAFKQRNATLLLSSVAEIKPLEVLSQVFRADPGEITINQLSYESKSAGIANVLIGGAVKEDEYAKLQEKADAFVDKLKTIQGTKEFNANVSLGQRGFNVKFTYERPR